MTTFVDINLLVDRQTEVFYLTRKNFDGYAASMYNSECLIKARRYWKGELFKQREKPTVLPRLQQLEKILMDTPDAWWEYGNRKRFRVYTDSALLATI